MPHWACPPEWQGETCFILAGGPSVAAVDLSRLEGRRVIAVNSSWTAYPAADVLLWHDDRWWDAYGGEVLECFKGRIVTTNRNRRRPEFLTMGRDAASVGIATDPTRLALGTTTTQGAINLAVHFGPRRIGLLGLDLKAEGQRFHHHAEYQWGTRPHTFAVQAIDLRMTIQPLRRLGVEVLNLSPVSTFDGFPRGDLEDLL